MDKNLNFDRLPIVQPYTSKNKQKKDTKEQTGDKEKSRTGLTAQQKDIDAQITLQLTDMRV